MKTGQEQILSGPHNDSTEPHNKFEKETISITTFHVHVLYNTYRSWDRSSNKLTQSNLRPRRSPPRRGDTALDGERGADLREGLHEAEGLLEAGGGVGEVGEVLQHGWNSSRNESESQNVNWITVSRYIFKGLLVRAFWNWK